MKRHYFWISLALTIGLLSTGDHALGRGFGGGGGFHGGGGGFGGGGSFGGRSQLRRRIWWGS